MVGIPNKPFVVRAHSLQEYTAVASTWNASRLGSVAASNREHAASEHADLQSVNSMHSGSRATYHSPTQDVAVEMGDSEGIWTQDDYDLLNERVQKFHDKAIRKGVAIHLQVSDFTVIKK